MEGFVGNLDLREAFVEGVLDMVEGEILMNGAHFSGNRFCNCGALTPDEKEEL